MDDEYFRPSDNFLSFSMYLKEYADNSVLISGMYSHKIIEQKRALYGGRIKHFYEFHVALLDHGFTGELQWDKKTAECRLADFMRTYDMFTDDESKRTMELYLRAVVNGEFTELFDTCHSDDKMQYFDDAILPSDIEVFVDCGAYDGDTICNFVERFPSYKNIYALEPDPENRRKLKQCLEERNIHRVHLISKGAYKESTMLHFLEDFGSSSRIDEQFGTMLPVVKLDDILSDCNDKILIKMDIEGSELNALEGAANIIRSKHPCLAICVYHKDSDLIKIPQYIVSLVDKGTYDYYLRFYGQDLEELVFYAITKYF